MLEFFRTYQRYFFICITVVIIASFSFFGTFSVMRQDEPQKDVVIGRALDGSSLMLSEVRGLSRFIAADREDARQGGAAPNLCNDGVVRYDLLRSGLADLFVAAYFEPLKEEFAVRLERAKRFRPYIHPTVPALSAERVWEQFLPALNRELKDLKEEAQAGPSVFSRLSRLYQQQSYLSAETLRRVLFFQHRQMGLGEADPRMQYEDLSLFGFHSLSDWFGRDFLDLAAEFILNGAALAEQKGFAVTLEEAKGDLLCNFQTSLQKNGSMLQDLTFHQHLQSLGFDEKGAAEIWRKVLLFRRYFQGISQASFIDRLPYRDFAAFAKETALAVVYQWPVSLRLKNFQDFCEFQTYLYAVAPPSGSPLDLPSSYLPIEEVRAANPDLVQTSFRIKETVLSLPEAALRASVREVWDWECSDENWLLLKETFSFLKDACLPQERFVCLEALSCAHRFQVDGFARLELLKSHPEWIEEKFAAFASQEQTVFFSGTAASLPQIELPEQLKGLFVGAAAREEVAEQALLSYCDDGKTVHRIESVRLETPEHILTFEEAKRVGLLSALVDRRLEAEYLRIRAKSPSCFKTKEGSWKTFSEVKNQVAKMVFSEVCKAIETLESREWTEDAYASYRLLPAARLAWEALQKDPRDPHWIAGGDGGLERQFTLTRQEMPIRRTEKNKESWMKQTSFSMLTSQWSPIHVPENGDITFFYLAEKNVSQAPILDQLSFGKELIAADAQRYLAERLLDELLRKQAIVLPIQSP